MLMSHDIVNKKSTLLRTCIKQPRFRHAFTYRDIRSKGNARFSHQQSPLNMFVTDLFPALG